MGVEVAVVGHLVGRGAVGIDHPDLIAVPDVSLIDNAAVGGPSETADAVHSSGGDLHGGIGVVPGTNPDIDVDVALHCQERSGMRPNAEREVTVHSSGSNASFL